MSEVQGGKTTRISLTEDEERRRQRRLKSATGQVASNFGYRLFRGTIVAIAGTRVRHIVVGTENLPVPADANYQADRFGRRKLGSKDLRPEACIIAPNHTNMRDISLVGQMPFGMLWLCKYAFVKWNWLSAITHRMGALPIFRPGIDDAEKISDGAVRSRRLVTYADFDEWSPIAFDVMKQGGSIVGFAEGTRRGDSQVNAGKSGVARLSVISGAPIIPFGISGCAKGDPQIRRGIFRRWVVVGVIGAPIYPDQFDHLEDRAQLDAMMAEWTAQINQARAKGLEILLSI